jgi:hypothetical protein
MTCITRAVKLRGLCPRCRSERLLVGRGGDGAPICVDCAGIKTTFTCKRCGREDQIWYSRTCIACSLDIRARIVLGDGNGKVVAHLVPLYKRLTETDNPLAGMTWLGKPAVTDRLRSLVSGATPLTHEGIDQLTAGHGREFLRELLVDVGLLPYRDKYLAAFETWREAFLDGIEEPEIRREMRIYLAWRHARNLAVQAEAGPLTARTTNRARNLTRAGFRFLRFVAERGHGLAELSQEDLDVFFAEASNPEMARDFLTFAMARRRCPRLCLPAHRPRSSRGSPLAHISGLVRQLLDDESIALVDRVAGLLVLLFAQPVTRLVELRTADLSEVDGMLTIALGSDPVPLPGPVAEIVSRYLVQRARTKTTNTTDFLFPGRRPGQPLTAFWLTKRLNQLGITKNERQGALTHLVSEVPAAVVAKATGYSLGATTQRASLVGMDWAHYAALKSGAAR